jgi:4-amino-4-deoxy-L-arabinose transferase-like glycosyltransferase
VFLTETGGLTWPGEAQVEPLQPALAAPLFWLADRLPFAGNVHLVMLFNPVVTVATAGLVYLFVLASGYPRRAGLAAALIFGLATIAWPYSKNFFREPLMGLTLFGTAYLLLRWRQALPSGVGRSLSWLVAAGVAAGLSLMAKTAAAFALPVLALAFVPWAELARWRRLAPPALAAAAAGLLCVAAGAWVYYTQPNFWGADQGLWSREAFDAFVGPLVSPGKSLFLYSPVFVLSALSLAARAEPDRRLEIAWPMALLLVYVSAYALFRGEIWWGGTGWGPRYMVPLTPFLVAGAAPALHQALRPGASLAARAGLAGLLAASLLVQIAGVVVYPLDYYAELERSGAGVAWTVGLWDPYYSAILTHWRLMSANLPDFAWARARAAGPDWPMAALLAAASAAFVGLAVSAGRRIVSRREAALGALGGLAVIMLAAGALLWRIYPDQRYRGDHAGLQALRQYWDTAGADLPERALFLNNLTYFDFVLNYSKASAPTFSLPLSPGDRLADGAALPPPATDPDSLVYEHARSIVEYFPGFYRTAGLLVETGPYHGTVVRSIEWWMAAHYHHIATREFAPEVRLATFSTARAPEAEAAPARAVDAGFGEAIALAGYDLAPAQATYRPGDVLNISLVWHASAAQAENYTVALVLIGAGPTLIQQHDSYPMAGFWPTSAFEPGRPVRDNVAFVLPGGLAPGTYEVWALMYDSAVQRLPVTSAAGEALGDHLVLFSFEVR